MHDIWDGPASVRVAYVVVAKRRGSQSAEPVEKCYPGVVAMLEESDDIILQ